MKPRKLVLLLAAIMLALSLLPAQTMAQGPPKGKGPVADERLFLLYVLEHFHRERLPLQPQQAAGLKAHVAGRKATVQQVIRRIQIQRLDPEIREQVEAYGEVLDRTVQGTAKLAELYRKHILPARQALEEEMKAQQARQKTNFSMALLTGLGKGFSSYLVGGKSGADATLDGVKAGFGRLLNDQARDLPKQRQRLQALKQQFNDAQKAYAEEVMQVTTDLARQHEEAVKGLRVKAREAARGLAEKYQWAAAEVPFGPDTATAKDRPRDPFSRLALIPIRPDSEDEGAAVYLKQAQEVIALNKLIPFADAYKPFRGELYILVGDLANRACAAEAGTGGFRPARAAPTAMLACKQFYRNTPDSRELKPFHLMLLAYAYSGPKQQVAAYRLLKERVLPPSELFYTQELKRRRNQAAALRRVEQFETWWHGESCRTLPNAAFWFDCARLCCLARDAKNGFHCLRNALACGYHDRDGAATHPELALLRQTNQTLFERLVAPSSKGANKTD